MTGRRGRRAGLQEETNETETRDDRERAARGQTDEDGCKARRRDEGRREPARDKDRVMLLA